MDADDLQKGYSLRFQACAAYRRRTWQVLTERFFQPLIGEDKSVLDLGSGWGEFINHIRARRRYALDLNPDGRTFLSREVEFFHQDSTHPWPLEDGLLDVVFTSNFFEHLPSKAHLSATIREARRCLKKDGMLIAMGPNIRHVGAAYWDFFDHFLPLSERSVTEILTIHDFKVVRSESRFLPYTMARRVEIPPLLVKLYLHLPLAWKLFGRQFLVIARS